jgi:hypothetical protein
MYVICEYLTAPYASQMNFGCRFIWHPYGMSHVCRMVAHRACIWGTADNVVGDGTANCSVVLGLDAS